MSWTHATLLALLAVLLALLCECHAGESGTEVFVFVSHLHADCSLKRIFMKEADASNFFRKRSRRGVKSQDEINIEQRQVLAADERKREFHEEKRNEFESSAEEDHDEQNERTRESTEQWREFHYDGMNPPHEYNRHSI
uniref:Unique cartilage matrix-associated protein n=1 Tax=Mastacembelus armatus TaxID=205130 RepID=A0A3Q3T1N5_9TELE